MSENRNNYPYKNSGVTSAYVFEIIADTVEDMPTDSTQADENGKFDTEYWSPGSTCLVLSNGATYKLNTQKQWVFWSSNYVGLNIQIVETLPPTGQEDTIYLIADEEGSEDNYYKEYLWINNSFELIGTTQLNIPNYDLTINHGYIQLIQDTEIKNQINTYEDFPGITYGYFENYPHDNSGGSQRIGTYKNKKVYRKTWLDTIKNDSSHHSSSSHTLKLLVEIKKESGQFDNTFHNKILNMSCTFFTHTSSVKHVTDVCQKITYYSDVQDSLPFRVLIPDDLWNNWIGISADNTSLAVLTVDYIDD